MNIIDGLEDSRLFGRVFPDLASWSSWVVFLKTLFAIPLSGEQELEVFRRHTNREHAPDKPAREGWVIAGRRAGKSRIAALVGVFLATFRDYREHLAPGERATIMLLAADRRQARVLLRYVRGMFENIPLLSSMVENEGKESIELNTRTVIEIHTSNYSSVRGYSLAAALLDECAFWPSDEGSSRPDIETVNALRPALSTIPGSLLLGISSPYSRRGLIWRMYKDHFAKEGDPLLVWQAATREMNHLIEQHVVDEALAEDEASARAEYFAEFRRDIESFVSLEVVEACTIPGRTHLPPAANLRYHAFCDPSGGSRDSFTLAIGHCTDDETVVVDVLAERRAPFSPESVVHEFSELLRQYRVTRVVSDKYSGQWSAESFLKHGIHCEQSAAPKSDLYRDLLPLLNSGRIELLDNKRLINQLVALERRTGRSGRDSIAEPPAGFDDLINATAGLASAAELKTTPIHTVEFLWG